MIALDLDDPRPVAEMIAKFRTRPGGPWEDLANGIEAVLIVAIKMARAEGREDASYDSAAGAIAAECLC